MARSSADLIARALGYLNVIQVGQDPSAEDAAIVRGYIPGKFSELARRQILYVSDPEAIDEEYYLPLAKILANAAGPEFGQPFDGDVDTREERRIRDINRSSSVRPVEAGEFI